MRSVAFGTSRPKTANTIFLKISASTNYSNYISVGMCNYTIDRELYRPMSSGSPGRQDCDCEYVHVKTLLDTSHGCLRNLLKEIWKVDYHKNDSAIHELEQSLYRSLVQEKKPHTHDMQTKPLAEWTDFEIFC